MSGTEAAARAAPEALSVIERWVETEFLPWRGWLAGPDGLTAQLDEYVQFHPGVFRFTIRDGRVRFHTKSGELLERHYPPGSEFATIEARGYGYERFLQTVVEAFDLSGDADLAVCLDDLQHHSVALPILSFQKRKGSSNILIPDVDFIDFNFYIDDRFGDPWTFEEKSPAAIFVGSTTGFLPIDHRMVAQLDHQRLRSAVRFRGHPTISYELPVITQCDGPETEQMIRDLRIGSVRRSWAEQLQRRYIISVDGNGATCSRVAVALRSRSLLIKYESPNQLYYFPGLRPFGNYIPVLTDDDVLHVVDMLDRSPALARAIAEDSRAFYARYLSRISVMAFTASVLRRYIAQFGDGPPASSPDALVFAIDCYVHIAGAGDRWATPHGWAGDGTHVIEGFELQPGPEIDAVDLSCQAIAADGQISAPVEGGRYCGSRGQGAPLSGFIINLTGRSAERFKLGYAGVFADGHQTGILASGDVCCSPGKAPITGFRLFIRRR